MKTVGQLHGRGAQKLCYLIMAHPPTGTTAQSGLGQTAAQQMDYYKLVYSIVETSIDSADVVKGVAFWRWSAAASPTTGLAAFDNYATISELSRL